MREYLIELYNRGLSGDLFRIKPLAGFYRDALKDKFSRHHVVKNVIANTFDTLSTIMGVHLYGVGVENNPIVRTFMKNYGSVSGPLLLDVLLTYPLTYGISLTIDKLTNKLPNRQPRDDILKNFFGAKSDADTLLALLSSIKYVGGATANLAYISINSLPKPYNSLTALGIGILFLVPYITTLRKNGKPNSSHSKHPQEIPYSCQSPETTNYDLNETV